MSFGFLLLVKLAYFICFKFIFRQLFCVLRVSFSVYELKKLRDSVKADSLKVILMYDIACIILLSSHLKVSTREMPNSNFFCHAALHPFTLIHFFSDTSHFYHS